MHHPLRLTLPLPLALLALAGCGGRTYPVTGKVGFKDGGDVTPLVGGLVVFEPLDGGARKSARGEIGPDGTFRLGTDKEGDGAAPGRYRVLVSAPAPPPSAKEQHPPPVLDPRYRDPGQSPLEFTVERRNNDCPLTVERPPGRPLAGPR